MLTDEQKLKAVETYLSWSAETIEEATEVLDQIWYVIIEGRYKPDATE